LCGIGAVRTKEREEHPTIIQTIEVHQRRANPQSRLWREAHDLAGHMLALWPKQGGYGRHKTPSDAARMLASLALLDDAAAIEAILTGVIAEGCFEKGDNDAIIGALGRLPPTRRSSLIERVMAGTAAASLGACANLLGPDGRRVAGPSHA